MSPSARVRISGATSHMRSQQAMRGLGTGEMPPLWARLGELTMPVTVVAGERDAKFRALGERMVALMPDARLVVMPGGHGLPLESPGELARAVDQVL